MTLQYWITSSKNKFKAFHIPQAKETHIKIKQNTSVIKITIKSGYSILSFVNFHRKIYIWTSLRIQTRTTGPGLQNKFQRVFITFSIHICILYEYLYFIFVSQFHLICFKMLPNISFYTSFNKFVGQKNSILHPPGFSKKFYFLDTKF